MWIQLGLSRSIDVYKRRGASIVSRCVVGDGIYAGEPGFGDPRAQTVKLDRTDFRELWRTPSEGASPERQYGTVLLMAGVQTVGVDAETGKRVWARQSRWGPLDWRGRLVLQTTDALEVVDPKAGEVQERIEVPGGMAWGMLVGDLLLQKKDFGGVVRLFDLTERRLLWERDLYAESEVPEDPRPIGLRDPKPGCALHFVAGGPGRFVMVAGAETFGCSLEDGRVLWRASVPVHYNWPNVHEGRVYVLDIGRFVALDEATGEVVYDVRPPELYGAIRGRPGTIYGDQIAFANESGHLFVFNLRNGKLVWWYKHGAPLWATAEADGRLLVSTGDGRLLVFTESGSGPYAH